MSEPAKPVSNFAAVEVEPDGAHIVLPLILDDGTALRLRIPSPLSAMVMRGLQTADAIARDRYLKVPAKSGSLVSMQVWEPQGMDVTREPLGQRLIVVFDPGLSTQQGFAIPKDAGIHLAQKLVQAHKSLDPVTTRPN